MFHNLNWTSANKGVKPLQPVEIDWGNSISKGLLAAYLPVNGGYINLVDQDFNSDTDGTIEGSPSGLGMFYSDYVPTGRINYQLQKLGPSLPEATVMSSVFVEGSLLGDQGLFTLSNSSSTFGFMLWADTFSSQLRPGLAIRQTTGATDIQYGVTGSIKQNEVSNVAASRAAGGEFRFCVNGESYSSVVAGSSAIDTDPYNYARIAQRESTTTAALWGGSIITYLWERQLSKLEMIRITEDPYQILKPKADTWYLIPKVSAAGPITVTPTVVSDLATVQDVTVQLASIDVSPTLLQDLASVLDPVLDLGTLSVSPALLTDLASVNNADLGLSLSLQPDTISDVINVLAVDVTFGTATIVPVTVQDIATVKPVVVDFDGAVTQAFYSNDDMIRLFRQTTGLDSYSFNELAIAYYKQIAASDKAQFNDLQRAAQQAGGFIGLAANDWRNFV